MSSSNFHLAVYTFHCVGCETGIPAAVLFDENKAAQLDIQNPSKVYVLVAQVVKALGLTVSTFERHWSQTLNANNPKFVECLTKNPFVKFITRKTERYADVSVLASKLLEWKPTNPRVQQFSMFASSSYGLNGIKDIDTGKWTIRVPYWGKAGGIIPPGIVKLCQRCVTIFPQTERTCKICEWLDPGSLPPAWAVSTDQDNSTSTENSLSIVEFDKFRCEFCSFEGHNAMSLKTHKRQKHISQNQKPTVEGDHSILSLHTETTPPCWPNDVHFGNTIQTIRDNRLFEFPLPSSKLKNAFEIRLLPLNHPAREDSESRGIFATRDLVYVRQQPADTKIIGWYAGRCHPRCSSKSRYIMVNDEDKVGGQKKPTHGGCVCDMDIDASDHGNEMRFINDYRSIMKSPNAKIGAPSPIPGAPEWLTPRPICITRTVKQGEEITLDYGEDYWDDLKDNNNENTCWTPTRGALVEVDMDHVNRSDIEDIEDFRSSIFPATFISFADDSAIVSLLEKTVEVPKKAIFMPRAGLPEAVFHKGEEVEVFWKGNCDNGSNIGWWPATIISPRLSAPGYHVVYKADFKGFCSKDIVEIDCIRPITPNRLPPPPLHKKHKKE